jgi:hypothetical protein
MTTDGILPGVDWTRVWGDVARRVDAHLTAGRRHLITEDTLRLETVCALQEAGVTPDRLTLEAVAPGLGRGKLDLALDGVSGTVIELKFPRDSRTGSSPDTMTFGELLRDFLRVAAVSARQRWVVQLLNRRLCRYLDQALRRHGQQWPQGAGDALHLDRGLLEALPRTARVAVGDTAWMLPVNAVCRVEHQVGDELLLLVHEVAAPTSGTRGEPLTIPAPSAARPSDSSNVRRDILAAIERLTERTGSELVTMPEVITELRRVGFRYADATIRTMMGSHMCVDSQGPGIGTYDDLERTGRGAYRLRTDQGAGEL